MKTIMVIWSCLLATTGLACDVCGIFLGVQPKDRTSSVSLLHRFRHLEGHLRSDVPAGGIPKHAGHGVDGIALTGNDHYRELYLVAEVRADIWLGERFALLASLPAVNNYRAVNGIISTDVSGLGDPLLIGRYLVANTRCLETDERTVHRLMLGAGAKAPLGRSDRTFFDAPVPVDLQPGTGTWDMLGTMEYVVRDGRNGVAVTMIGRHNGTSASGYRLGHGLSTTTELFRSWNLGDGTTLMPALGLYHELSGRDAEAGQLVHGTGGSTLFLHFGSRLWWRSWMLMANLQHAVVRHVGELMVPNRTRIVAGVTYNISKH